MGAYSCLLESHRSGSNGEERTTEPPSLILFHLCVSFSFESGYISTQIEFIWTTRRGARRGSVFVFFVVLQRILFQDPCWDLTDSFTQKITVGTYSSSFATAQISNGSLSSAKYQSSTILLLIQSSLVIAQLGWCHCRKVYHSRGPLREPWSQVSTAASNPCFQTRSSWKQILMVLP